MGINGKENLANTSATVESGARASETALSEGEIAYRKLADAGRRTTLASQLPQTGPLTLSQAEAWLESAQPDGDGQWTDRIVTASDQLSQQWRALIVAEAELARGGGAVDERAFESWIAAVDGPRGDAEAERDRLASRAVAMLARARLGEQRSLGQLLNTPAAQLLPGWEREYLQALAKWQLDDQSAAIAGLRRALALSAEQTPVRLPLATLLASEAQEEACELLDHAEPTREMCAAQAALLARLRRYDEAEAVLARCEVEPTHRGEAARYSWARGRAEAREREQMLRAALAERRGDWATADRAWRAACAGEGRKSLREARQLFAARQELQTLAPGKRWRRELLEQRLERGRREFGQVPLLGDALFFRALALDDNAVKDLQTLLGRRAWIKAEQRAGGGRLVSIGDALLRLGRFEDAIRAYELVGPSLPGVKDRLAAASFCLEIESQPDAASRSAATTRLTGDSPRLQGLAALGLLLAGDTTAALARAAEVEKADELLARALRIVCQALTGAGAASLTAADIAALKLPPETETLLQWLCGEGTELDKLKGLVQRHGEKWIAHCPVNADLAARRLLAAWCDAGEWDQAVAYARGLARSSQPWAIDLAALVQLRHALARAMRGELEEAARELEETL